MSELKTAEQHNNPLVGHSALSRPSCRPGFFDRLKSSIVNRKSQLGRLPADEEFFQAVQALLDMHLEGDHERAEQLAEGLVKLERRRRLEKGAGIQEPESRMVEGCCEVCGGKH